MIPASYTCDGADLSPGMHWRGVPAGTKELALIIVNPGKPHSFPDWGVLGLKPTLHGLSAGKLPAGAIVGRNGHGGLGYSVCPTKGTSTTFGVGLFAVPHHIAARPGFDTIHLLESVEGGKDKYAVLVFTYKRP